MSLHKVLPAQVKLQRASVHMFENQSTGLVLTTSAAPLTRRSAGNAAAFDSLEGYFRELLVEAVQDPKTQLARFLKVPPQSPAPVRDLIDALFRSPGNQNLFHQTSVKLAERLLEPLKNSLRGSAKRSAYFILAQYEAAGELGFAILKLDHDEHLEINVRPRSSGAPTVVVHAQDLPTANRHKDKFAFIVAPEKRRRYDLLVTDRKYQPADYDRKVARFFLEGFLAAAFVEDSAFLTAQFIDVVRGFAKKQQKVFEEQQVKMDLYYTGLDHYVQKNQITLTDFLESVLPDHGQLRQTLHQELVDAGVETASFKVDSHCVAEKTSRRKITLSNRIWIAGERDDLSKALTIAQLGAGYRFELEAPSYVEN